MNSPRLVACLFVVLSLSACASLPGMKEASAPPPDQLLEAETKVASLEAQLARLKSENARLANKLLEAQRDRDRVAMNDSNAPELRDATQDLPPAPEVNLPAPLPLENAVVDEAKAPDLRGSDVPVESAPRLVQPNFASDSTVFENEDNGDIETASVLYGVHLASYRQATEAREGWRKLQRENPDELGLLEPRLEAVEIPEKGSFLRLIGGGFSSNEKAQALCGQMEQKGLFCAVVGFNGQRLAANP